MVDNGRRSRGRLLRIRACQGVPAAAQTNFAKGTIISSPFALPAALRQIPPHHTSQRIRFFEEKANGKSKGYALVEFASPEGATAAKARVICALVPLGRAPDVLAFASLSCGHSLRLGPAECNVARGVPFPVNH